MADDFELLESLLWEPDSGYFLLERHLARLDGSARYFAFALDAAKLRAGLAERAARFERARKVRVLLARSGRFEIQDEEPKSGRALLLALALEPVDSADPFLRHKTTRREVYTRALAAAPEADDVVLWNERGELTETCHGNLALELEGRRLTPALGAGLLPGTYRAELLSRGELAEARLVKADLARSQAVFMVNSVRKSCAARLR